MATMKNIMGKITLEKLAAMVRDGFASMDDRFNALERKFDAKLDVKISDLRAEMNERFDQVDEEIKGLHHVDDGLNKRLSRVEKRVDVLEKGPNSFGLQT